MEWAAAGIVVAVAPYGEGDALASIFTQDRGVFRGLVKGGLSRAKAAVWQPGNLVEVRWVARLAEQLGSFTGELVHPAAAMAMHDALRLGVLSAACAVAEGALPEREPQPRIFRGLLHLIAHLGDGVQGIAGLVAWEVGLLSELGYGLDLSCCAVTGEVGDLAYVSPRTGRAVGAAAAGVWRERLLPLPGFLLGGEAGGTADLVAGLNLTGHFLARDVFGARHRGMPASRLMLADRLAALDPRSSTQAVLS